MVDEYHSILAMLEDASGENLITFAIPRSMMVRRIVSEVKHYTTHMHPDIQTELSAQVYCDKEFFKERMEQLSQHFSFPNRA